jgi:hypothetical protein
MRGRLTHYKQQARELAGAEYHRNAIPGDVKLALSAVATQMQSAVAAIEACGIAVESHMQSEHFRD